MRRFRLWLATKLLGFMAPHTFLIRAKRKDGTVQWDGGLLHEGMPHRGVTPIGLDALCYPDNIYENLP